MQTKTTSQAGERTQFAAYDVYGRPLQFTGTGRSIQCDRLAQADRFGTREEAESALEEAQEFGGSVSTIAKAEGRVS